VITVAGKTGIAAALVALLTIGCQGVIAPASMPSTATPAPLATTTTRPTSATATAEPSMATGTPTPTLFDGSPVICPSSLPTELRSVEELADRSCYGTTELTIDGLLADGSIDTSHNEATPSWVMPSASLYATSPTVGEFVYDTLAVGRRGLEVVAKPDAGIDLSGIGRWVTLRGHFNDPDALACVPTLQDSYPGEWAGPDCDRLFVVTDLQPNLHVGDECGRDSLTVAEFLAADAACFIGREVHVVGWEDVGEGFGGAAAVYPFELDPSMRRARAQLVANRWESDLEHDPIFPMTIAGSGVRFDRSDLRVVVTGMLGHPVAQGCRPAVLEGWTWSPPRSWAQHQCQHLFVITAVHIR